MELRETSSEGKESSSRQCQLVFPLIEAFFRATLNPA
jgi:hypothetical protein